MVSGSDDTILPRPGLGSWPSHDDDSPAPGHTLAAPFTDATNKRTPAKSPTTPRNTENPASNPAGTLIHGR